MENQHQKWVNLSYLAIAAVFGYVAFSLSQKMVGLYDLEARIRNVDLMVRIGSIAISAGLFGILYRNARTTQFMNEVMVELSRVTWPTQKETSSATVVVIVMVIISGMILGLLDYTWTQLLRWVL
jgi:preprotein translocase SecE subunit